MKDILADGCEVVHLQEIWNTGQIKQVEEAIGLDYVSYAPNLKARNGLMSLSRWNIQRTEYQKFQYNSDGGLFDRGRELAKVEKGFAVQWLETPAGLVAFVNLHLHPRSQAVRVAQILQLIQWRMKVQPVGLLVTGDFNMTPDSLEHALFRQGLRVQDAVEDLRGYGSGFCTYCRENRLAWLNQDLVFDYVFYAGAVQIQNVKVNLKGSVDQPLSDHYGLRVEGVLRASLVGKPELHAGERSLSGTLVRAEKSFQKLDSDMSKQSVKTIASWQSQLESESGPFWNYVIANKIQTPSPKIAKTFPPSSSR